MLNLWGFWRCCGNLTSAFTERCWELHGLLVSPHAALLQTDNFNLPWLIMIQGPMQCSYVFLCLFSHSGACNAWDNCRFICLSPPEGPRGQRIQHCLLSIFHFQRHGKPVTFVKNCLILPWKWLSWHECQHFSCLLTMSEDNNPSHISESYLVITGSAPWERVNTSQTPVFFSYRTWSHWIFSTSGTGKLNHGKAKCLWTHPKVIDHHEEVEIEYLRQPRLIVVVLTSIALSCLVDSSVYTYTHFYSCIKTSPNRFSDFLCISGCVDNQMQQRAMLHPHRCAPPPPYHFHLLVEQKP